MSVIVPMKAMSDFQRYACADICPPGYTYVSFQHHLTGVPIKDHKGVQFVEDFYNKKRSQNSVAASAPKTLSLVKG